MYERARWDRPTLKSYAKTSLKNFYWKGVLATLIVMVLTGGLSNSASNPAITVEQEIGKNGTITMEGLHDFFSGIDTVSGAAVSLLSTLVVLIAAVAMIIGVVYSIFVANPLHVGHNRFYLDSRFAPTDIGRIFSGFTGGHYGNVVKTMFLKSLYEFGWSLLFVIPGIIKAYEYAMVPYILAENPDMPSERALELSKEMMRGRKWDLFVLDLSFFGWNLLASVLVIGHIFLKPYIQATHAEVYLWLRYDALCNGYAHPAELNGLFAE